MAEVRRLFVVVVPYSEQRPLLFQLPVPYLGEGIFSEVDTLLTTSTLTGNNAVEAGGGAAFQPAPCLSSLVIVDGSTFDSNTGMDGDMLLIFLFFFV